LRGIGIVFALNVVAPAIGADEGAVTNCIASKIGIARGRTDLVGIIVKDTFNKKAGLRGNP
jgi:hypothetical protein